MAVACCTASTVVSCNLLRYATQQIDHFLGRLSSLQIMISISTLICFGSSSTLPLAYVGSQYHLYRVALASSGRIFQDFV